MMPGNRSRRFGEDKGANSGERMDVREMRVVAQLPEGFSRSRSLFVCPVKSEQTVVEN